MISASGLTKVYGGKTALDHADFTVRPGVVTGFLGPNGSGKSTAMRLILNLDRATSGSVTVNGRPYRDLPAPLREVGALLEAKAWHGGRSAYNHLRFLAGTNGIPRRRVREVLDVVGLHDVAAKRAKGYSLGMGQRLGIAAALLGDPAILMFDEPVNGLDPEGILWIRRLMQSLAAEGRTVFVSSHLMSEMALTAGHLIVIGRGRILADTPMADFVPASHVRVRSPDLAALARAVAAENWRARTTADALLVYGVTPADLGDLAYRHGIRVHELSPVHPSLEEAFMRLTAESVEFHGIDG
ncbi:ATP-binding cassette domain-containing protein [Herbidospora sp. NEAU-GS84]|uniref:ATP-binding cassette domain-containing protein n=1 Tax=Herbidospora solisilvae TaxID=2696284 RepID=A0A7C9N711_9ACTN|nr:ATP-binding cassette domain-containing protein [Herbidospora solisilvae]NAS22713.1 ATP-binding cassette domain-containing protein [Herbidospora solisilvae]